MKSLNGIQAVVIGGATAAFDKQTGAILYMINDRQFVVISAGGGKSGRPAGGSIIAFSLPEPAPN